MKKNIFILSFICLVFLISCKTRIEKKRNITNLETSINYVVKNINKCYEGGNQLEVDEKAEYDSSSKTLIIFIGESKNNFIQKWEIPLTELDENTVKIDTSNIDVLEIFTLNKEDKIKYYSKTEKDGKSNETHYYLPSYCYTFREKKMLAESFKKSIILSKIND
jgi:DNA mismatch repair ATPase MutS